MLVFQNRLIYLIMLYDQENSTICICQTTTRRSFLSPGTVGSGWAGVALGCPVCCGMLRPGLKPQVRGVHTAGVDGNLGHLQTGH